MISKVTINHLRDTYLKAGNKRDIEASKKKTASMMYDLHIDRAQLGSIIPPKRCQVAAVECIEKAFEKNRTNYKSSAKRLAGER